MNTLLSIIFLIFAFSPSVFAQDSPEDTAKKYGITFPIAELGSCISYSECRTYCEDPTNQNACVDFAKKKGFYKDDKIDQQKDTLVSAAKRELGCESEASCQDFCTQEVNFDKCNGFAKKHSLSGGYAKDPTKAEILDKAKEFLGCNSYKSCMAFCQTEANFNKCSEFAKSSGLAGGEVHAGPGGCTSEETCRAFCSDPNNYQICSSYSSSSGSDFNGPGGCNSQASCQSYCEKNPNECEFHQGGEPSSYNPQEMCNKTPNCSWINNTCQCGSYGEMEESGQKAQEYVDFCRENPDKCGPGQQGSFESSPAYPSGGYSNDPAKACAQYPGCTWVNNTCNCSGNTDANTQPTSGIGSDPQSECVKNGCSWNGSSCDCGNKTSSSNPESECTKQSGCSWTGSSCNCSSTQTQTQTQTYDPATECGKTVGCSWTGSTCQCSSVQGVKTQHSLLQSLLNFLLGR